MSDVLNQTIESIYITQSFSYTLWYQNFTDAEGDDIIIDCSTISTTPVVDSSWVLTSQNVSSQGNITIYGETPRDNANAGIYVIHCTVEDEFDAPPNVYDFTLKVLPKEPVVIESNLTFVSFRLPNNISLDLSG